jgi:hypothetical protein
MSWFISHDGKITDCDGNGPVEDDEQDEGDES